MFLLTRTACTVVALAATTMALLPGVTQEPKKVGCAILKDLIGERAGLAQFITFERLGSREPRYEGESAERVWLRFHNNSTCGVWINAPARIEADEDGGLVQAPLEDGREIATRIEIQRQGSGLSPAPYHGGGSNTYGLLPGGRSVVFSVPLNLFLEGNNIAVRFDYEWERARTLYGGERLVHRAFFFCRDLSYEVEGVCAGVAPSDSHDEKK